MLIGTKRSRCKIFRYVFYIRSIVKATLTHVQSYWWLQIIAAVEMKRIDSEKWEDLVKQLIGYMRRILREQLDRRFVFGLTLGPEMLTVWMYDRSGVIGTRTAISIHKAGHMSICLVSMHYSHVFTCTHRILRNLYKWLRRSHFYRLKSWDLIPRSNCSYRPTRP